VSVSGDVRHGADVILRTSDHRPERREERPVVSQQHIGHRAAITVEIPTHPTMEPAGE
jgi:hypothetical protein